MKVLPLPIIMEAEVGAANTWDGVVVAVEEEEGAGGVTMMEDVDEIFIVAVGILMEVEVAAEEDGVVDTTVEVAVAEEVDGIITSIKEAMTMVVSRVGTRKIMPVRGVVIL